MRSHLVCSRSPDAISCELDTGAAILESRTNFYFTLNSTGALVWEMLPASLEGISAQLAVKFGIGQDILAADVGLLLDQMKQHNLIVIGAVADVDEPPTA